MSHWQRTCDISSTRLAMRSSINQCSNEMKIPAWILQISKNMLHPSAASHPICPNALNYAKTIHSNRHLVCLSFIEVFYGE
jgi:hypothetical protein